jgi:hypothetical protein
MCQNVHFEKFTQWTPQHFFYNFEVVGTKNPDTAFGSAAAYWTDVTFKNIPYGATIRFKEGDIVDLDFRAKHKEDSTVEGGFRRPAKANL